MSASPEREHLTVWRGVEAAAVLLVLGFFLFGVREILNPPLLFLLLWAVLAPFRGRPGHGELLLTAGILALVWLLATTGTLLAPFVLSVVLAYVLDPLVDRLEARRVPRGAAIVLLTIPVLALLAVLLLLGIPAAAHQMGEVVDEAPVFFQRAAGWLDALRERLLRVDLPLLDEDALIQRLREVDSESVVAFLQGRRAALASWVWASVLGLGRGIGTVLSVGSYVVLTPVLTFYLLRDWDRLVAAAGGLIPPRRRDGVGAFAREYDHLLGRYLRGQLTVALFLGVYTAAGLALLRFPYAATLGLLVAVFSVVPYLGLALSLAPAIFIALVSGSVGVALLKVAAVYVTAQMLEGTVVSPRIVGGSVGLHPVWVVLALTVGGFFFGFVGLLVAVPAAVGIKLLARRGVERYRGSALFRGGAAEPPSAPV